MPGKFKLKGFERVKSLSSYNTHGEDQYLPRQRRDVTYVSRLQVRIIMWQFACVHVACTHIIMHYNIYNYTCIPMPVL